jgi:hypothetical protein
MVETCGDWMKNESVVMAVRRSARSVGLLRGWTICMYFSVCSFFTILLLLSVESCVSLTARAFSVQLLCSLQTEPSA